MLQISILLLLLTDLPRIIGPDVRQNGFEADRKPRNLRETDSFDAVLKNTGLERRSTKSKEEGTGQTLEACFGGIGRWISRTLQKRICCFCCFGKSMGLEGKSGNPADHSDGHCVFVKAGDCVGRAFVGSAEEAAKMIGTPGSEQRFSSLRSSSDHTITSKTAYDTNNFAVTGNVHQYFGGGKKANLSKKDGIKRPGTSSRGPPRCCLERKGCFLFTKYFVLPVLYCLSLPCISYEACIEHSWDPITHPIEHYTDKNYK